MYNNFMRFFDKRFTELLNYPVPNVGFENITNRICLFLTWGKMYKNAPYYRPLSWSVAAEFRCSDPCNPAMWSISTHCILDVGWTQFECFLAFHWLVALPVYLASTSGGGAERGNIQNNIFLYYFLMLLIVLENLLKRWVCTLYKGEGVFFITNKLITLFQTYFFWGGGS